MNARRLFLFSLSENMSKNFMGFTKTGDLILVRRVVSFLLILAFFILPVSAVNTTTLGCEDVYVKQGDFFTVPLSLTNNKGIVAVRIKIKYPYKVMELTDISCGELTQEGLFNTTVTDYYSVKGEFDVVWSTTENIEDDGTLVMLTFKASDLSENGKYKIEINYEKEDTFNEDFEDVVLDCSPVIVTVNDGTTVSNDLGTDSFTEFTTTDETTITNNTDSSTHNSVSDDYLISSVESILGSLNESDINNITDAATQQIILDFVNNRIDAFGENIPHIETFDELKDAFSKAKENKAVKDIVESTDSDIILSVFDEIKEQYGVEKLEEIPKEKQQEVIKKVTEKLIDNNSEIESFNKLDEKQKIHVLDEIIKKNQEQEANSINIEDEAEEKADYKAVIITVVFALVLIVSIIVILVLKQKSGNEK
ncbi:MAG: cohesin domain-containing protein [Acutalibacteraceae bacterium]